MHAQCPPVTQAQCVTAATSSKARCSGEETNTALGLNQDTAVELAPREETATRMKPAENDETATASVSESMMLAGNPSLLTSHAAQETSTAQQQLATRLENTADGYNDGRENMKN